MNNEPESGSPVDEVKFVQGVINLRMDVCNDVAQKMQDVCKAHPARPTVYEIYLALTTSLTAFIDVTNISEIERQVLDSLLCKQIEEHKAKLEQIRKN